MEHSRAYVFKEIQIFDQILFQWFRLANQDEDGYIIPAELLEPPEHWARLSVD